MNIQEAIKSGKPFRRRGWVDDNIFVVYEEGDIVLLIETDRYTSIELDVPDILAVDWYTRDEVSVVLPTEHVHT
jgi:hypothetical protein